MKENVCQHLVDVSRQTNEHRDFNEKCQDFYEWLGAVGEELDRWSDVAGADKEATQKKLVKVKVSGNIVNVIKYFIGCT